MERENASLSTSGMRLVRFLAPFQFTFALNWRRKLKIQDEEICDRNLDVLMAIS